MSKENNKLLAEFLGFAVDEDTTDIFYPKEKTVFDHKTRLTVVFETDWNWLMKVVEKIEGLTVKSTINGIMVTMGKQLNQKHFCYIEWGNTINVRNGHRNLSGFYSKTVEDSDLMAAVYNACVEFVKWYNANGK